MHLKEPVDSKEALGEWMSKDGIILRETHTHTHIHTHTQLLETSTKALFLLFKEEGGSGELKGIGDPSSSQPSDQWWRLKGGFRVVITLLDKLELIYKYE
jgi:hypothetical protein